MEKLRLATQSPPSPISADAYEFKGATSQPLLAVSDVSTVTVDTLENRTLHSHGVGSGEISICTGLFRWKTYGYCP